VKSLDNNFSFVIAGGGSAGWLTALYLKKNFPLSNVTLIASSKIGILGAGEGTTPHFVQFLNEIDISVADIIKNASGTIKIGTKFTNWNKAPDYYLHSFSQNKQLDLYSSFLNYSSTPLLVLDNIAVGKNTNDIDFYNLLSECDKVPFFPSKERIDKNYDGVDHFEKLGNYGIHFNAQEFAIYLSKLGSERGIIHIDGEIQEGKLDSNGNITSIITNKGEIKCDFVFDCTGFKRFFIGNLYKSKWTSYKKYLTVDKAIPFFLPYKEKKILSHTESFAMKYGWVWKIAVQNRYGCGYVYDSSLISDELAAKELSSFLGVDVELGKVFNFEAGSFNQTWINNCISVGLASGFIEPLEATNMWVMIVMLRKFMSHINGITHNNQETKKEFNEFVSDFNDSVMAFIYLHYFTDRNDTEFWKQFKPSSENIPYKMKSFLQHIKNDFPTEYYFKNEQAFGLFSWLLTGAGIKLFSPEIAKEKMYSMLQGIRDGSYFIHKDNHLKNINLNTSHCIDHYNFIQYVRNN